MLAGPLLQPRALTGDEVVALEPLPRSAIHASPFVAAPHLRSNRLWPVAVEAILRRGGSGISYEIQRATRSAIKAATAAMSGNGQRDGQAKADRAARTTSRRMGVGRARPSVSHLDLARG